MSSVTRRAIIEAAVAVVTQVAVCYATYSLYQSYVGRDTGKKTDARTEALLKSRGHKDLTLNEYERTIAAEIIHPDDLDVGFADIGGLDPIIASLRESVIYPLVYPHLFPSSSLLAAPKGVLLHGPPGCGKTMLAKALAHESGATFINVAASTLANKWYGESNKLVAGMFSLARKCQPSIVFFDEIDSFLRERTKGDHEVTGMMKAEFMTLWDGLTSSSDRIIILGATNRIADIDPAFMRRMPKRFAVGLPSAEQREKILTKMLANTPLAPDFAIRDLAQGTPGMSGSDLKELCRAAVMSGIRQSMRAVEESQGRELDAVLRDGDHKAFEVRPLSIHDFVDAIRDLVGNTLPPDGLPDGDLDGSTLPPSPVPVPKDEDRARIDEEPEMD